MWALLTIVPDCTRPFHPLGSIGMSADNNGKVISVDADGPAAAAGITYFDFARNTRGDLIDLEATARPSLIEVFGGLGGMQYLPVGRKVTLHLIDPRGRRTVVTLTARKEPLDVAAAVVLEIDQMLGIGFILLGAWLAWAFPRRSTFGFFLFALWFNPGQYFTFYAYLSPDAMLVQEVLQAIFQAAGIAGFLEFALRFPTDRLENWRARVEPFVPVLFGALVTLGLLSFGTEFGRRSEQFSRAAYGLAYAVYPLVAFAFMTKLRVLSRTDVLRLRWVIAGCIPGLFCFILADSIESTSMWQWLWDKLNWQPPEMWLNLAYMVNALVAISVAYAVIRQRVLPVAYLVNRGLALAIVWIAATMAVEGILVAMHAVLDERVSSIVTGFIVVTVAPLFEVVEEHLTDAIDRLMFRRFHEGEQRLAAVAKSLAAATSIDGIDRQLVDAPCAAFGIASAAVFRAADDGSYALAPYARGWSAGAATALAADDPLVLRLRQTSASVRIADLLRDEADFPGGVAHPSIAIPLGTDHMPDAVVLYGGHDTGTDLSPDEVEDLVWLAAAAAAARDHVRTVSLRRQVQELQQRLAPAVAT